MKTLKYMTPEGERILKLKLKYSGQNKISVQDGKEIYERNGEKIKVEKLNWQVITDETKNQQGIIF